MTDEALRGVDPPAQEHGGDQQQQDHHGRGQSRNHEHDGGIQDDEREYAVTDRRLDAPGSWVKYGSNASAGSRNRVRSEGSRR